MCEFLATSLDVRFQDSVVGHEHFPRLARVQKHGITPAVPTVDPPLQYRGAVPPMKPKRTTGFGLQDTARKIARRRQQVIEETETPPPAHAALPGQRPGTRRVRLRTPIQAAARGLKDDHATLG